MIQDLTTDAYDYGILKESVNQFLFVFPLYQNMNDENRI